MKEAKHGRDKLDPNTYISKLFFKKIHRKLDWAYR